MICCRSRSSSNHLYSLDLRIGSSKAWVSAEFVQLHIGCTVCGLVETTVCATVFETVVYASRIRPQCLCMWRGIHGRGLDPDIYSLTPKRSRYSFGFIFICWTNALRSACSSRKPVTRAISLSDRFRDSRCCRAASTRSDRTHRAGVVPKLPSN